MVPSLITCKSGFWLGFSLTAICLRIGVAEDVTVALNRTEIQAVRLIQAFYEPSRLDDLSPVGKDTLFGERAKDLELVVISDSGVWRWRTESDPVLTRGRQGSADDGDILQSCINCSGLSAPHWGGLTCMQVEYELARADESLTSGNPIYMDNPQLRDLLELAKDAMEDEQLPPDARRRISQSTGEVLLQLPATQQAKLKGELPQIQQWMEEWTNDAMRVDRATGEKLDRAAVARDALIADAIEKFSLTPGGRAIKHRFPLRKVEGTNTFVAPISGERELIMRLSPDKSLSAKEVSEAGLEKFTDWAEKGDFEIFVRQRNSVFSVPRDKWKSKADAIIRDRR